MRVRTGEDAEIGQQKFGFQNNPQTEQKTLGKSTVPGTLGVNTSQRCSALV